MIPRQSTDLDVSRHHAPGLVLDAFPTPPEWVESALCAQIDPDYWFPEKGAAVPAAKRVCARCPVQQECLETAMENDERFGVWGGLSESERRQLRRARKLEEGAA